MQLLDFDMKEIKLKQSSEKIDFLQMKKVLINTQNTSI